MIKKARQIGFSASLNHVPESEPNSKKESKTDYVAMALDSYLGQYKPYNPDEPDNCVEVMTSKEIRDNVADMVAASVSEVTKYMVAHGYRMTNVEGGRLCWELSPRH